MPLSRAPSPSFDGPNGLLSSRYFRARSLTNPSSWIRQTVLEEHRNLFFHGHKDDSLSLLLLLPPTLAFGDNVLLGIKSMEDLQALEIP